jgi:hypothetical protein
MKKRREMLKTGAISFVLGFLLTGLLLLCFPLGLAIIADVRGWGSFSIRGGLLTIFGYERTTGGTQTVIGTGTVVISLLAGLPNALAGRMLWSRTSGGP